MRGERGGSVDRGSVGTDLPGGDEALERCYRALRELVEVRTLLVLFLLKFIVYWFSAIDKTALCYFVGKTFCPRWNILI